MTHADLDIQAHGDGCSLAVKVVPGAKRDEITGLLGTALKIRVSAPPEDGKANQAVCRLLAEALQIPRTAVLVIHGHTRPQKRIAIQGLTPQIADMKLRNHLSAS